MFRVRDWASMYELIVVRPLPDGGVIDAVELKVHGPFTV